MEWVRGEIIGRGSFSTVNLATPRRVCSEIPSFMAVKSTLQAQSSMLHKEKDILDHLGDSPRILRCLGEDTTFENGQELYNVFLELASRGNLAEIVKNSGGKMKESDVRYYTRSIVQGLCYIHERNYVHCDIKLQNILVCSFEDVKIGDFGLAKKAGEKRDLCLSGTPLYMSPESISRNEQESPSDIWALGCAVLEMMTGKPAWNCGGDANVTSLLFRIGFTEELPEIPEEILEQGKDFLRRCLVRDPTERWTAEMLLNHPFVADCVIPLPDTIPSPTSALDFPDWSPQGESFNCFKREECSSPDDRIRELATVKRRNWSTSGDWIRVRREDSPVSKLH